MKTTDDYNPLPTLDGNDWRNEPQPWREPRTELYRAAAAPDETEQRREAAGSSRLVGLFCWLCLTFAVVVFGLMFADLWK